MEDICRFRLHQMESGSRPSSVKNQRFLTASPRWGEALVRWSIAQSLLLEEKVARQRRVGCGVRPGGACPRDKRGADCCAVFRLYGFRYLSPFLIRLACRRSTFPPGEGFFAAGTKPSGRRAVTNTTALAHAIAGGLAARELSAATGRPAFTWILHFFDNGFDILRL